MSTAVRSAAEQAHHRLPVSFLGAPSIAGVTSATAIMEVATQLKVGPRPESGFHPQHVVGSTEPPPYAVLEPHNVGGVTEVVTVLVVVLLICGQAYVSIRDAAGKVLAHAMPLRS
jgi:hypothetical protein